MQGKKVHTQIYRLVIGCLGLVQLVQGKVGIAQIIIGNGKLRVQSDGFFEVRNRLTGPVQFIECGSQVGQGLNEIGINPDRVLEQGHGLFQFARAKIITSKI